MSALKFNTYQNLQRCYRNISFSRFICSPARAHLQTERERLTRTGADSARARSNGHCILGHDFSIEENRELSRLLISYNLIATPVRPILFSKFNASLFPSNFSLRKFHTGRYVLSESATTSTHKAQNSSPPPASSPDKPSTTTPPPEGQSAKSESSDNSTESSSSDAQNGNQTQAKPQRFARFRAAIKVVFRYFFPSTMRGALLATRVSALLGLLGCFFGGIAFMIYSGGEPVDEKGDTIPDKYSKYPPPLSWVLRSSAAMRKLPSDIIEPIRPKLLPEPLKPPLYQPPYTLVLELNDLLLKDEWRLDKGWRCKKRPGIDYLLEHVGWPHFELVIFTNKTGMTAWGLVDKIDSEGHIMYRLFRDSTRYYKGTYYKDLRMLNRDLSRVIAVDVDAQALADTPENTIIVPKWDGDHRNDRTLYDLANFLRLIEASNLKDVRPMLAHYRAQGDILEVFRQKQSRFIEEQRRQEQSTKKGLGIAPGSRVPQLSLPGLKF